MWITISLLDGKYLYLIVNVELEFALSYLLAVVYLTHPELWGPHRLECHHSAIEPVLFVAQPGKVVQGK
jgi:hypothetical protein